MRILLRLYNLNSESWKKWFWGKLEWVPLYFTMSMIKKCHCDDIRIELSFPLSHSKFVFNMEKFTIRLHTPAFGLKVIQSGRPLMDHKYQGVTKCLQDDPGVVLRVLCVNDHSVKVQCHLALVLVMIFNVLCYVLACLFADSLEMVLL